MIFILKATLNNLVSEHSIADSRGTVGLVLAVLLKYGIAPLACVYFCWAITEKDLMLQKNNDTVVGLVREQTTATVKTTAVLEGLNVTLQRMEQERKNERRNSN